MRYNQSGLRHVAEVPCAEEQEKLVTRAGTLALMGMGWLSALPVWAGPQVVVQTLDGTEHRGELTALTPDSVSLQTSAEPLTLPAEQLMNLSRLEAPDSDGDLGAAARLIDGSELRVEEVLLAEGSASLKSASGTEVTVSVRELADLRFSPLDAKIRASWSELRDRSARDDLLVIRKGDVLDYVAGTVGRVTPEAVTLLVRERELSAPRERVFGVVFASRSTSAGSKGVEVQSVAGDRYRAEQVALTGETLSFRTPSLGDVTLPLSELRGIDYGGGRLRSLADLPFDDSESRAVSQDSNPVWFVSLNAPAGSGGRAPLVIGKEEYRRGLWLHSGAVVRFRLNREFTRLRATAGFDITHITRMPRFDPRVRLVLSGDNRELYSQEFGWNDPPAEIDVDLSDVRDLIVRVESLGGHGGILEHFALGNAQLIQ